MTPSTNEQNADLSRTDSILLSSRLNDLFGNEWELPTLKAIFQVHHFIAQSEDIKPDGIDDGMEVLWVLAEAIFEKD